MGATRTDLYTEEQLRLASIAKVLGHPARVAILQHLLKSSACICGDIVDEIGLSQPTISQHLREMKDIGLIKGSTEGTRVNYCINNEVYQNIKKTFSLIFNEKYPIKKC